jgi:Trp operon repressor
MTPQDEKKWRDLCHQAMNQNDVNQLLKIFLELDRATEREQRAQILSEAVRQHRQIGLEGHTGTK